MAQQGDSNDYKIFVPNVDVDGPCPLLGELEVGGGLPHLECLLHLTVNLSLTQSRLGSMSISALLNLG